MASCAPPGKVFPEIVGGQAPLIPPDGDRLLAGGRDNPKAPLVQAEGFGQDARRPQEDRPGRFSVFRRQQPRYPIPGIE